MEGKTVGPFLVQKRLGNKRQKVYRAFQKEQNREVALKFISLPPTVSRETGLRKIQKEVRFLQKLSHPNLAKFYGAGIEGDGIFFAIELIQGESLSAMLARRGRLAWDLAVDYARQLAVVLQYLHAQDLLHCKLTPDKVLLSNRQIKLTDLRLNRSRKRRWDAKEREELEIAAYMAPEQLTGQGATEQSDLYSVGAIIYEMVTGKIPYPPETLERMTKRKRLQKIEPISQIVPDCPIWLDKVVAKLMDPSPSKRFLSAEALVLALDELQKIDRNQTSSTAQMAGGFNALTAGIDKSEARSLLGKNAPAPDPDPSEQADGFAGKWTTALLGGGLALAMVIFGVVLVLMNVSLKTLTERAEKVAGDPDATISQIVNMERELERMVKRDPESEAAEKANGLIQKLGEKRLLGLAKRGRKGFHPAETKLFIQSYQDWMEGKSISAIKGYRKVLRQIDPESSDKHLLQTVTRKQLDIVEKEYAEELKKNLKNAAAKKEEKQHKDLAVDAVDVFDQLEEYKEWIGQLKKQYPDLSQQEDGLQEKERSEN